MLFYLLLYPSLTRTQQAAAALTQEGIQTQLIRSPRAISREGCGHCIRLEQGNLPRAVRVLTRQALPPKRVYVTAGDGNYEEAML